MATTKTVTSVALASVQPNPNAAPNDKLLTVLYSDGTTQNKTYNRVVSSITSRNNNIAQIQADITATTAEKTAIEAVTALGITPVTI